MAVKEGLVDTILKRAFARFQILYIAYLVALSYFEIEFREFEWNKFTPFEEALKGGAYFFLATLVFTLYLITVELLRSTSFHRIIEKTKITRLIICVLFCSILLFLGNCTHEIHLLFIPWIILGATYSEKLSKQLFISTFMILCFAVPTVIAKYPDTSWGILLVLIFFTYGIAFATAYAWNRITDAEMHFFNLNNVAHQINGYDDLDALLNYTLQSCLKITNAKNGWVLLFDQISEKLILKASIEAGKPGDISTREFSLDKGIIGFVARTREVYLCQDVSKDKHYEEIYPETRSELCVPMLWSDELIGIIDLEISEYNGFDEFDKNNILFISMSAASSIKRINYLGNLDKVMQINGLIARSLKLDTVLDTFLNESRRLVNVDYGLILFVDSSLKLSRSKISNNLHTLPVEEVKKRVEKNRKTYDASVDWIQNMTEICYVIKYGRRYIYQNVAEEVGKDNFILHWFFKEVFGSVIALPLKYAGKVIGELTIGSTKPNAFSGDQVRLLEMIAEQTSIAIKNAYDFEKADFDLEMKKKEIETIGSIVNIATARKVDEVIHLILSEAVKLVGAVSGHVRLFDKETGNLILKACVGEYKRFAEPVKKPGNDLASQAFIKGEPMCIVHSQDDKYIIRRLKRYHGTQRYVDFVKFFNEFKTALVAPFKGEAGLRGYIVVFSKFTKIETRMQMELLKRFAGLMAYALNVARLNEITKEQSLERQAKLKLLSKIGLSLREAESFDQLMKLIVEHTFVTLNSESCSLFLLNKETSKLQRKENKAEGEINFDEEYVIDEGITGKLLSRKTGEALIVIAEEMINRDAVPKYLKEYKSALPSGKIEHFIAVPLIGENKKVFGVLRIMNKKSQNYFTTDKANKLQKNGFSIEDKELIETIGSAVSVAISSERKAARLRIIADTSTIITSLDHIEKISSVIVDKITSGGLGYSACVLNLIENDQLVPISWSGISDEYIKYCKIPLDKEIGGESVLENKIKYIEDVGSNDLNINKGYLFTDFARREKLKSSLVISLLVGDFPIGEIAVYTRQTYIFLPYEIKLLETLANQLAISISNSKYMREQLLFDEKIKSMMNISMFEQISSSIIHNVNSLFSNFQTRLELLDYDLDNKNIIKAKANLAKAFDDIKKASGYTKSLQLYRKARGEETEQDVKDIIKMACEMYSGSAHRRRIKLSPIISPKMPSKIFINENRLLTVLLSLIFNAVDFSHGGRPVYVKASYNTKEQCVKIEVEDQGRGMNEETQMHLFDPFYTTRLRDLQKEGTGLGLYIVKNICTKMHWRLSFESKKFKGTKFNIEIPVEGKNDN